VDEILKRDQNSAVVLGGITDDSNQYIRMLRVDPNTNRLLVSGTGGGGGGGGISIITVTGTVNDTNETFAASSQPTVLVINGETYSPTGGEITWTYVGGTITLSSPVGIGGSIFGMGGGISVITIAGTINDTNETFTASSQPTVLVINGDTYQMNGGNITWLYSGGTITLSSPVGIGGSIFGF
jgi:hypothetical protein